jgi:hypothetical protein
MCKESMNMSTSKKINYVKRCFLILLLLTLLLLPFAIYFGAVYWTMSVHGIPVSKIVQLHEGMSEDEVKTLVGEPKDIDSRDDGSKEWRYSRNTWCCVHIYFSPEGKVIRIIHDH